MKIRKCYLAQKASKPKDFPGEDLPEVAFLGRSNVGKSSLINAYLGRKNLAKTSSTPGKTRALFFYLVNDSFYLVDLPGYGYARVSKAMRNSWGELIETYLFERPQLKGMVHIVDIRHSPTEDDRLMSDWLLNLGFPFITVATKADKIAKGRHLDRVKKMEKELDLPGDYKIYPFSAQNKIGLEEVTEFIDRLVSS